MSSAPVAPRVVSLVPSVTETLLAWGIAPVAVTRFCEQPDLPAVGGTKDPDVAAIVASAPDLVVLCREENRREDADALAAAGLATEVLQVEAVGDVPVELGRLARRVGLDPASVGLGAVHDPLPPARARAVVPIWRRPWMVLGPATYGASLLRSLGVVTVPDEVDPDHRYPERSLDELAGERPDLVLVPTEPYPFGARHLPELAAVAPAVLVDGQDLLWWGVRTPAARQRLARAVDEALGG